MDLNYKNVLNVNCRNAEELATLNQRIEAELQRQKVAEVEAKRVQGTLNEVAKILWKFCDRLRVSGR